MAFAIVEQDPNAIEDWTFNWTRWLNGATIVSATWDVPEGLTKISDLTETPMSSLRITGGTPGETYECVNHIIASDGRETDRTLAVVIKEM